MTAEAIRMLPASTARPARRRPGLAAASRPRIVLVMPEFNESRTIIPVLTEAAAFVDRIIIVDDGSRDDSHALINTWMRTGPTCAVDLLRHPENRGMSGALLSGFAQVHDLLAAGMLSGDDIVVNIDADGQHDPAEIPTLVDFLQERDLDVVLGRRDLGGYPRYKRFGNWALSLSGSLLAGCRYRDIECGFRAMRARAVPGLIRHFSGHRYGCAQEIGVILPRLGYAVSNDLPVHVRYYREGARFRDGAVNASMGLVALARVVLGLRAQPDRRAATTLATVSRISVPAG